MGPSSIFLCLSITIVHYSNITLYPNQLGINYSRYRDLVMIVEVCISIALLY